MKLFSNPALQRHGLRLMSTVVLVALMMAAPARAELPPPTANMELIPAGSLIIAMDNDKQNIGALFNLKAYGMANHLLWENVRVKWAIRAGKAKDGIDFTVKAQRILPTAVAEATLDFRGGPFIVHKDLAAYAAASTNYLTSKGAESTQAALDKVQSCRGTLWRGQQMTP